MHKILFLNSDPAEKATFYQTTFNFWIGIVYGYVRTSFTFFFFHILFFNIVFFLSYKFAHYNIFLDNKRLIGKNLTSKISFLLVWKSETQSDVKLFIWNTRKKTLLKFSFFKKAGKSVQTGQQYLKCKLIQTNKKNSFTKAEKKALVVPNLN